MKVIVAIVAVGGIFIFYLDGGSETESYFGG
jgi:hypothetical protein